MDLSYDENYPLWKSVVDGNADRLSESVCMHVVIPIVLYGDFFPAQTEQLTLPSRSFCHSHQKCDAESPARPTRSLALRM